MIIGITGASGSGKSVASAVFEQNGFFVIDLDKISHEIYNSSRECVNEVCKAFGNEILDENGKIIRKKLGGIVFADSKKLHILNEITHKYILKETFLLLKGKKNVVLDAPLLFETGLEKHCDITLGILSPRRKNSERIISRDKVSRNYAENRLKNQKNDDFFVQNCTYCIHNDGNIEDLIKKTVSFIKNEVKID